MSARSLPFVLVLAALAPSAALAAEGDCDFDVNPLDLGAFADLHLYGVQSLSAADLWIEGAVASGLGLSLERFDVGSGAPGAAVQATYGLVLTDGTVHGDVVSAVYTTISGVGYADGAALLPPSSAAPGLPLSELLALTGRLSDLPATGEARVLPWSAVRLTGSDARLNVFDLDVDDLSGNRQVLIEAPAGAAVVVNVSGYSATISNFNVSLAGPSAEDVIWNFETATSIALFDSSFYGTILAPQANLYMRGGWFEGAAATRYIDTRTSTAWAPFTNAVDSCPTAAPPVTGSCRARHEITGWWPIVRGEANIVEVEVEWTGPPLRAWEVGWTLTRSETITSLWGGIYSRSGLDITVRQPVWGGGLDSGERLAFGYIAEGRLGTVSPAVTTLNGVACSAW